ncbi:hypothetical protein ACFORJ_00460 [Corynebacterium hansenii]|uniref:Uncharacterized protein n=1 Tax=Corynebacterium hansenii TaxID=394964 RepID=A0ABV7ZMC0_9CORY|nr:hypothetical protein [Corynebacterium hansenii]WJY99528.1 hypothetical protein CHAN_04525 [Corynebacterium hansenii]
MLNRPYLIPSEERIDFEDWTRRVGEDWSVLEDGIPDWNPGTDLEISRPYEIDIDGIRADCGLADHSAVRVTVSWSSDSTKMGGIVALDIVVDEKQRSIRGKLDGMEIGGRLTLRTTVTAVPAAGSEEGSPSSPGTVLYEDSQTVLLGDDEGKFPVCIDDFAHTPFDPDASWYFELDSTDLTASFNSASVLHLNERDEKLVKATTAENPTPTQKTLLRELSHGLSTHMLHLAMEIDRVEELGEVSSWPVGSLGAMFSLLLEQAQLSGSNLGGGLDQITRLRASLEGITRRQGKGRPF